MFRQHCLPDQFNHPEFLGIFLDLHKSAGYNTHRTQISYIGIQLACYLGARPKNGFIEKQHNHS